MLKAKFNKPAWALRLGVALAALAALGLVAACGSDPTSTPVPPVPAATAAPVAQQEAPAAVIQTVVQVAQPVGEAVAQAAPLTGWDTEYSKLMGIRVLQTFDSSGPAFVERGGAPRGVLCLRGPRLRWVD